MKSLPWLIIAFATATLILSAGCSTPYTRRIEQLDAAYQRGDLSREDYWRFVRDAQVWERYNWFPNTDSRGYPAGAPPNYTTGAPPQ